MAQGMDGVAQAPYALRLEDHLLRSRKVKSLGWASCRIKDGDQIWQFHEIRLTSASFLDLMFWASLRNAG